MRTKKTQQKQILRIQKAISTYTYKYPNYMCYDKEYKEKGTEQHFLVCHQLFTRNNTQKNYCPAKKEKKSYYRRYSGIELNKKKKFVAWNSEKRDKRNVISAYKRNRMSSTLVVTLFFHI